MFMPEEPPPPDHGEVSALIADVCDLQHHVGCEAALDREIPLLVVEGPERRRLRALTDSGRLPRAGPANCPADTQNRPGMDC